MPPLHLRLAALLFLTFLGPGRAGEPLLPATPFPTVAAFAAERQIPLSGFELAGETATPRRGDRVTLLLTLSEKNRRQQWLALLEADDLTARERPPQPLADVTLHSSAGFTLRFTRTLTALRVSLVGPFTETAGKLPASAAPSLTDPHRVLVSPEQLSFGLDRYAHTALQLAERARVAGVNLRELFHIGSGGPLTEEQLQRGRRYVEVIHPTEEEERRVFGVYFALNAFLTAALEVDDFKAILERVLDKPSLWSALSRLGVNAFLHYDQEMVREVEARPPGLDLPVYGLPVNLHLNGKPALRATLAMTSPRPPLQVCAGILAIAAEHPAHPNRRLQIEVVAARSAPR